MAAGAGRSPARTVPSSIAWGRRRPRDPVRRASLRTISKIGGNGRPPRAFGCGKTLLASPRTRPSGCAARMPAAAVLRSSGNLPSRASATIRTPPSSIARMFATPRGAGRSDTTCPAPAQATSTRGSPLSTATAPPRGPSRSSFSGPSRYRSRREEIPSHPGFYTGDRFHGGGFQFVGRGFSFASPTRAEHDADLGGGGPATPSSWRPWIFQCRFDQLHDLAPPLCPCMTYQACGPVFEDLAAPRGISAFGARSASTTAACGSSHLDEHVVGRLLKLGSRPASGNTRPRTATPRAGEPPGQAERLAEGDAGVPRARSAI